MIVKSACWLKYHLSGAGAGVRTEVCWSVGHWGMLFSTELSRTIGGIGLFLAGAPSAKLLLAGLPRRGSAIASSIG